VGLERIKDLKLSVEQKVSFIPHGGLRTMRVVYDWFGKESLFRSPSHTVGLEHGFPGSKLSINLKSPSHTVGLELQTTTLTKIRHINHFVKRAPLSNEVNFPKSEIMQS
jgi:hypothetical protein